MRQCKRNNPTRISVKSTGKLSFRCRYKVQFSSVVDDSAVG